jgi:hypothetical protein
MAASAHGSAKADHRQHVAVAAQSADDQVHWIRRRLEFATLASPMPIVALRLLADKAQRAALLCRVIVATMAESPPRSCVVAPLLSVTPSMTNANPPLDDDDDAELELEPVDPEILEIERRRAQRKTDEAVARIDPDELFREEGEIGLGIDWSGLKQFRFTTRHLLILTAMLALVMTLFIQVEDPCSGIAIISVIVLGAGWYWVLRQERRQEAERARRREEFFASHGKRGEAATTEPAVAADATPAKRFDFKFAYSLKELFAAMTAAAVVLGVLALIGPDKMALALGIVALLGLVVQTAGLDPPRMIVLGWWMLLVLYLAVGVIAALRPDEAAARGGAPLDILTAALDIGRHD